MLRWCRFPTLFSNRPQIVAQGRIWFSPFFLSRLSRWQPSQLALQVVVDGFLNGTNGELQGAIPHLARFRAYLSGFYVDELPFFKLANVFGHRVGAHARVLANPPDAGPALMRFPVLAEDQVGVDRQLAGSQSQREDLVGQKKITAQRAGIIEGGEGNATEDAHGNDRRPGTEGTFSPKAGSALDLSFVYEETAKLYSHRYGRPPYDPVVMVKYLLVGYLYGIPSERQIEQRIQTDMALRWYLGLDVFDRVPDHSTISQLRRRKPSFRKVFRRLFEKVVEQCIQKGLVSGRLVATDWCGIKKVDSLFSRIS